MAAEQSRPYITICLMSRNDGYATERTRLCILNIIRQLEKFAVPSELLLTEWIPPRGKPLLRDAFPWPSGLKHCRVRVAVVPEEARGYSYSEEFPIQGTMPWNTGIRRASGLFVLHTATDTLLSDELVEYLSRQALDENAFYRIDRCDVDRRIVAEGMDDPLAYAASHIVDMHTLNPMKFLLKPSVPVLHDKAPGDYLLMSRQRWHMLRGMPQDINCGADTLLMYMAYFSGARQVILRPPMRLYHIDHDSFWKSPAYTALRRFLVRMKVPYKAVDVLARAGAAMVPVKSSYEKRSGGLVSSADIKRMIIEMKKGKRHFVYNDGDWGLGNVNLDIFEVN